ncbi:4a-hydroxytetrahydrobiopterin dehydratase [Bacillus pinisoli]|uniref:4a-hydroxytetrahydrobiopterin dehydratase n=1 Tax=Bacillus pinisoli TaxID=2901866 RepID=UPI001FF2FEA7|nr:4a-hydroxytetrahydrobiopterin dehydratase [Bacillus pinisoli]
MEKLTLKQIEDNLTKLEKWNVVDEIWLEKKYRFKEYLNGIDFVNRVANLSEEMNHHPFISIDYKLITLKMSSWQARGLTELDFKLAHDFDRVYAASRKDIDK